MLNNLQVEVLKLATEQNFKILQKKFNQLDDKDKYFTTNDGKNLLHFVCKQKTENTLPIIQFLLDAGINPESLDENFQSPLDVAKKNNNTPTLALMKYFINRKNYELNN